MFYFMPFNNTQEILLAKKELWLLQWSRQPYVLLIVRKTEIILTK